MIGGDVKVTTSRCLLRLALLVVSSARLGTSRAGSAGVLGSFHIVKAAGSSPAAGETCAFPCCSGAAGAAIPTGAAILGIAAQTDGCAVAGAGDDQPGCRGQRGTLFQAVLGTLCAVFNQKFESGPARIVVRQRS